MNPKVSILVPVYNVSLYIEKCAISLFNQTFEDIEFIFVNDATPDDSIEILQRVITKYPERKKNIKIINNSYNSGLAVSRNIALETSSGSYISVVDSDDFIEPNMIELLFQKAIEEDADIVISDIFMEYIDKTILVKDYLSENNAEHFRDMIRNEKTYSFLCTKLIKRTLYMKHECRIPDGLNYLEDRHVMTRMFYFAKKIVKVDQAFYHYVRYNENSITKNKVRMHFENVVQFWDLLDTFLKEHNEFKKYEKIIELSKVENKVILLFGTHSSQLRKEFANIFYNEETKCLFKFKKSELLMLLLVRYKMFGLAQLFNTLLIEKNKMHLRKLQKSQSR